MSVKPLFRLAWQTTRITVLLALLLGAVFVPTQTARALTFTVNTTADTVDASPGNGVCADASSQCSLRAAIMEANALADADTINLPAGTYQLTRANAGGVNEDGNSTGDLDINASLTITGAGAGSTIIQAGTNTTNGIDKVFGINPFCANGVNVTIDGVTIRYGRNTQPYGAPDYSYTGGGLDWCGGTGTESFTLSNSVVSDNTNVNGYGGGLNIDSFSGYTGDITITNVTFQNNQSQINRVGNTWGGGAIHIKGHRPDVIITNSTFTNNSIIDPDSAGGAVYYGPGWGGSLTVHGSTFTNNTASWGGGIGIYHLVSPAVGSPAVTIDQNAQIANNTATSGGGGIYIGGSYLNGTFLLSDLRVLQNTAPEGGGIYVGLANATVRYSRIVDNHSTAGTGTGLYKDNNAATVTALNNWWGCSTGPGAAPCDTAVTAGGTLTYAPWLRDLLTAATSPLVTNQSTSLTASFLTDSGGTAVALGNLTQIIGLPVTWAATNGNLSGTENTVQAAGTATGSFQATAAGTAIISAKVDNDNTAPTSSNVLSLTINRANTTTAITSDLPDPSVLGQAVTVTFTVTGAYGNSPTAPTGNVTVTDGVDSCTGTVAVGSCSITLTTPGTRTLTATYAGDANFNPSPASAGVSHTVNQAPAITSGNSATFTVGSAGTFTVTTTGLPTGASMLISRVGALPAGVAFTNNGDGTATLAGTPAAGAGGTYFLTITASNGVAPDATQNFTLNVNQAPAITSANTTTFAETLAGSFTVTTSGFPTGTSMTISEVGALPAGVTFTDNGDGTAALAGTPALGTQGNYPITITTANGILPNDTQSFTLVVEPNLRITSANNTTFTVGSAGSFTVTTIGVPIPTLSRSGSLPSGVTFVDNGDGTGTLSGTPAAGTAGTYPITFTASNGVAPNYVQNFTLTVNQAPVITSVNNTTFTIGGAGTFTVTTTGFPTGASMSISEVGALPSGVTFTDNGDDTAALAGTPALGTVGIYPLTITASNGVAPDATQNFTLTINQAATNTAITSDPPDPSVVGQVVTFNYTVSVVPPGGGTPAGNVTVSNGTDSCTGTVAAGSCPITFTAPGTSNFTATYAGNANYAGSTSAIEAHTVNQAATTTAITSDAPDPSVIGQTVTFDYTVNVAAPGAGTPTGNVTISNGTESCTGTVAAGSCPITFTAPGTTNFTATYAGDANFSGSTSAIESHTVNQASTTTSITSDLPDPSLVGQSVTVNFGVAVVAPGTGTPAGNVTVSDGINNCVGTVATGTCNITLTTTGARTLTATYGGNANFSGSASVGEPHTVSQAPAITSANNTGFEIGVAGSFTVTTSGYPIPGITQGGALPLGVNFVDNGDGTATLNGTPAAGTSGVYSLTFTANNGVAPNATQNFTLTVGEAPTITSANNVTFTVGSAGSFTVTTSGYPIPSITRVGALPSGINFNDNGDGTVTLSGTPAAGTGGVYNLTLTASNSLLPNAIQNFTLTVNQAPAITSANNVAFTVGAAGSFTVTTTGFPLPAISEAGILPTGVTFTDNGDGTATMSGTPAVGSGGDYNLTFTANNGVPPNATQNFTFTVGESPVITSPNNITFVAGNVSSFTVTTTGSPDPAITRGGALPSGITFSDNGDGTATLAGTPALGSVGTYNLTFTANNGIAPNATQNFMLSVNGPPGVTLINSNVDTGDGQVIENEHTNIAITQLLVVFNKDMNADTPGDLDDVLTVANYSLVQGVSTVIPVNGVITYNAATDTATLDVNGGVALPNGKYTLTVEGRIEDTLGAPIGTNFTRIFYVDSGYPYPTSIITVQNNATITNGATINVSFSSINVTFNEDVSNAGGGAGIDDVTNPLNYLLLQTGSNGAYDTTSCQAFATNGNAPLGDDIRIPTGTVTYTNNGGTGPFVATVPLNGGTALPNGAYRFLICGTTSIVDLAGNPLNNAADSQVDFTILVLGSVKRNPKTGFAPGVVTVLPEQPADKAYASLGDLWIEIPKLNLKTSITGVPLMTDGWDVTWLNRQVGWLEGTAYPTWGGNTVLTAHGYTADGESGPFALLKNLSYGETIVIHLGGMKYTYAVRTNTLTSPNNTYWLTKHEKQDWITLITCQQYDEKTKSYRYRRVVRAVLIQVEEE